MEWNTYPKRPEACECRGQYEGGHLRCQLCGTPHRWGPERVHYYEDAVGIREMGWRAQSPVFERGVYGWGPTRAAALADLQREVRGREARKAVKVTPTRIVIDGVGEIDIDSATGHPTGGDIPVAEGWRPVSPDRSLPAVCEDHECWPPGVEWHRDLPAATWEHTGHLGVVDRLCCDKHVPRQDAAPDEQPVAEGWEKAGAGYRWPRRPHVPRQDAKPDEATTTINFNSPLSEADIARRIVGVSMHDDGAVQVTSEHRADGGVLVTNVQRVGCKP